MPNIRNMNQPNPFLDLLSAFNSGGADHPFFAAFNPEARDRGAPPSHGAQDTPPSSDEEAAPGPRPGDHPSQPGGPHRGRPQHHHGPPPHRHGASSHEHAHGGPHRRGGRCGGGGRNFNPWATGMGGFDMSKLMDFIPQFAPEGAVPNAEKSETGGKDFAPDADIFDTEDAFVVHVSLPGAKKEDVGVNWNADKSELSVAGVIYRPGGEEFLKCLALDERKVGVFERKVRLGDKEAPASVDSEGITAKMEEGILIITIPKVESFVDVKKVDIE